jgi:hypothetical protein
MKHLYVRLCTWLQSLLPANKLLRQHCYYCNKTLGFVPSRHGGESGGICIKCLKEQHPESYALLKQSNDLTPEEIAEAEGPET